MHAEASPMFSEKNLAIEAEGLGKCYRLYDKPSQRLRQALPWQRRRLYREYWALRDVSLTLPQGQTLGVIGRNGSGKSTLLQLICGTLTPSEGHVRVNGRIGALLELGSGFNPEFTGIENVRLNAAVLGLKGSDVDRKMEGILAFADIGDFVSQPVKNYSSGMVIRLAFAVQAYIDPAVLIVDEALAVGDELFQKKCFSRLKELKENGASIILVSHSCTQINQHCDRVIMLNKGCIAMEGESQLVTNVYQQLLNEPEEKWRSILSRQYISESSWAVTGGLKSEVGMLEENQTKRTIASARLNDSLISVSKIEYKSKGAKIDSIIMTTPDGIEINTVPHRQAFCIKIKLSAIKDFKRLRIGCFIANKEGTRVTGQAYPRQRENGLEMQSGNEETHEFRFRGGLWPGIYFVGAGLTEVGINGRFIHRIVDALAIQVVGKEDILTIGDTDMSLE